MIISEVKGANLSAKYVAISSQKLINDLKSNGFELSGFQTNLQLSSMSQQQIRLLKN